MRYHDDRYASKILLEAVFEVALHRKNGTIPRGREEVLDQLTDTYRFIHVSTIRDHHDKIDAVKEYATVAVSEFQRVVVRKCQILLYVIGERAISDLSIDHQYADAVIAALGDIAQLVMSSSLPSTDHDALVRLAIMRIEYLGTKAANLDRPEVNDKAKNELRRIIANPSENGQRLRNVAEASLSILNAS